jgi:hypothetical protein
MHTHNCTRTRKQMLARARLPVRTHTCTHLVTHTQTSKPRKYAQTHTQRETLARARAPLRARAHKHTKAHTYAWMFDGRRCCTHHTLFSSCAHTIILLC